MRVPSTTLVPPVYVLFPLKSKIPVPFFTTEPLPETMPEIVMVWLPSVTNALPAVVIFPDTVIFAVVELNVWPLDISRFKAIS